MTTSAPLDSLKTALQEVLSDRILSLHLNHGECTLTVSHAQYLSVVTDLRDHPALAFEQLMDLCGMDYAAYKDGAESIYAEGPRYCVVSHLLSVSLNWRVRLKVFEKLIRCHRDEAQPS